MQPHTYTHMQTPCSPQLFAVMHFAMFNFLHIKHHLLAGILYPAPAALHSPGRTEAPINEVYIKAGINSLAHNDLTGLRLLEYPDQEDQL